eukprot:CAMPEP_0203806460 /NCGR_PEP_ID=MMETSP0115-20131106/497_1 /ASSEMBLY_ACC=CAM_ASM_000227 /TAXON_ID=33651 /ORGANISM="Bicosoecid sp, Strain ms1" /LENGTH=167 /DNA_ID=CAMNT_0050715119 /DNA_START=77 /DNA_END=577 /DNA_ORIENTATION=-
MLPRPATRPSASESLALWRGAEALVRLPRHERVEVRVLHRRQHALHKVLVDVLLEERAELVVERAAALIQKRAEVAALALDEALQQALKFRQELLVQLVPFQPVLFVPDSSPPELFCVLIREGLKELVERRAQVRARLRQQRPVVLLVSSLPPARLVVLAVRHGARL